MNNNDLFLTLHNVGIGYRKGSQCRLLISQLDGSLQAGELVCLVGRNGCGKSTLLRTMAGLQAPLQGEIEVHTPSDMKPMTKLTAEELAHSIGIVLTQHEPLAHTSVEELVALGRTPYTNYWGRLTAHDQSIVQQAMELIGIAPLKERTVDTLSDGEQQKCMIAKAIAQETSVLLLDEPSAFLDYPSKLELMQLLQQLAHKAHKAILLSTHDIDLAIDFADRIWHIHDGRLNVTEPCEFDKNDL